MVNPDSENRFNIEFVDTPYNAFFLYIELIWVTKPSRIRIRC
jgi:hypothetical protein